MHFSIIITLGFHFLLCQRVSSNHLSFLKNQTLTTDETDDVLGKFFVQYNKVYLRKQNPRHVTVIGASVNELQKARPFFVSHPYSICRDSETCFFAENYCSRSFFILFLDDLSDKPIKNNANNLGSCRNECKFLFIFKGIVRSNEITMFFQQIRGQSMYSELVHLYENAVRLYRPSLRRNCSLESQLVLVWRPGIDLGKNYSSTFYYVNDLYGCPISISTIRSVPNMLIENDKNGSLAIVGGQDGMLVLAIAKKLNFNIVVKYPPKSSCNNYSTHDVILDQVGAGTVAIGISRLRPTDKHWKTIRFSKMYDQECVTWGIPHMIGRVENIAWEEFPWQMWVSIGLVFFFSCMIKYAQHNIDLMKNDNRKDVGFLAILLDVFSINLEHPAIYVPVSTGGRLILMLYLFYSLIVSTAYKTSLASMLATTVSSPAIVNLQGIIEANFKVGGSQYNINILKAQSSLSKRVSKLIDRFEVIDNESKVIHRLKSSQDFAALAPRSILNYEKRVAVDVHEVVTYEILDKCLLIYPVVMAFQIGFVLRIPVNEIIQRFKESGIPTHWADVTYLDVRISQRQNFAKLSEDYSKQKFEIIFIFYGGCLVVCLLVFFIELLTPRFKPKKTRHI